MVGTLRVDITLEYSLTHPIAATAIAAAVSTLPLVAAAAAITTAVAAIISEIRHREVNNLT